MLQHRYHSWIHFSYGAVLSYIFCGNCYSHSHPSVWCGCIAPYLQGIVHIHTSLLICSNLVSSLLSLHSQVFCGGALKFHSLFMILPAVISCAIYCCHNRKSLRGGFSFGNQKVDHCSPSPLCFRHFLSKDFPDAPKTSDKDKTCWCTRNLLSRRRSSVKCPLRFNSIIIHLSLFLGCSSGILQIPTIIPNLSTSYQILLNHPSVMQDPYLL